MIKLNSIVSALFISLSFMAFAILSPSLAHEPISFAGSTTVDSLVIRPHKNTVDRILNHETVIYPSSSGRGVLSVLDGKANIGMISAPLSVVLKKLKEQGHDIDAKLFKTVTLRTSEVTFIIHPQNPVRDLSKEDVKEIFSGNIMDWNYFGHPELGIIEVSTEHNTGGMFTLIENELLGQAMKRDRLQMQNAPQVIKVVSQLPNAIGFASKATPSSLLSQVKQVCLEECDVKQNLFFIYKTDIPKAEEDEILKVIELYKEQIK